jgi:hypothetical protein
VRQHHRHIVGVFLASVGWAVSASAQASPDAAQPFIHDLRAQVAAAQQRDRHALKGRDGFLFFTASLRATSIGPFWGPAAANVSAASNKKYADPLEPIVDFHQQLRSAGIELLLVPVPTKATIYPDKISGKAPDKPIRVDPFHVRFYVALRKRGVKVLDPTDTFRREAKRGTNLVYCQTDTHFSGYGCRLLAQQIAAAVPKAKADAPIEYRTTEKQVTITGDLARMLADRTPETEKIKVWFVSHGAAGALPKPIKINRQSPILLIGDSHTLVFHAGDDMHTRGAGLPDHLAAQFGQPVDLIGVRGSGGNVALRMLYRRRDQLAGKKLVIWCISARAFTESDDGWRKVPVIRKTR